MALAHLTGRIAAHYTKTGLRDAAINALNDAAPLVSSDAAAQKWIDCCNKRVNIARDRGEHSERIRSKLARIRSLDQQLSQWETDGSANRESELEALQAELQGLKTKP